MNISEISNYLIEHSSIINIDSFFENYLLEIKQPNNCILKLFTYKKYTFETFMNDLNEFNLEYASIRIKLDDKLIKTKYKNINKIINYYYNKAIDIIFIFYFDLNGLIAFNEFKNIKPSVYYKRYYIIHCQNIRDLQFIISNSYSNINEDEYKEMKENIERLKLKNLTLCQELDQVKLSSQDNINYSNGEYLKLQLEYEQLEQKEHNLKSKLHKYKHKLKEYVNNNKYLNNKIIE